MLRQLMDTIYANKWYGIIDLKKTEFIDHVFSPQEIAVY